MKHHTFRLTAMVATAALCSMSVACKNDDSTSPTTTSSFTVTNLVADASGMGTTTVDPNLVNSWGIAFGPTGILWVANAETGTSTLYDALGAKQTLIVTIPTSNAATGGAPTGTIFNSTTDFQVSGTSAAFLFAGEDGVISAWTPGTTSGVKVADRSSNGAVFKGLAIASDAGVNRLFATNFKQGEIDEFGADFTFVKSFTDASIPAGYGPFGIQNVGGLLYVTFAKQLGPDNEDDQPGAGLGFVVVFNPDGTVSKRFASNGNLNAPWGIAVAPAGFGELSNAILVGNFGDGKIGAYNATTGAFLGFLKSSTNQPIVIDGLWGLTFGVGASATKLFFASGPNEESHGLVGTISFNQ